jgi:hypothetical protein
MGPEVSRIMGIETAVFAILVFLPGGRPRRGWHRRRGNEVFGAKVLGHEIGVLKPFRVVALRLHH